eukprot:scaffold2347_cov173-Amphora_coffeaeformis.AAC.5
MIPCPGTTRPRRGTTPAYKLATPSSRIILMKQSNVDVYRLACVPCMRVLTTSKGLFPNVLKHPADIPPNNPSSGVMGLLPLSVTSALYSLNHMNRRPWLDPCFKAVAVAP